MNFNIKDVITGLTFYNDITLVTVYNLPNKTSSVAKLFSMLGEADINVDMISLNPSQGLSQTVSFSAMDDDRAFLVIFARFQQQPFVSHSLKCLYLFSDLFLGQTMPADFIGTFITAIFAVVNAIIR